MATQTLAEAAKFIDDEIVRGVVEDIISINPLFEAMPSTGYTGQGIVLNRELALGGVEMASVGDNIGTIGGGTGKDPATYTNLAAVTATKIIGDTELDHLVQVQSQSDGVDQLALEISSKAKNVGRKFQTGLATGTGSAPEMNSLHSVVDAAQYTGTSATQVLSFALLDELLDLPLSKDGQVDFIMMPRRTSRSYRALNRALGGVSEQYTKFDSDRIVDSYLGIPIFVNDYLSVVETANGAALTGGALTSVWAGNWDDGTQKVGISAIHPDGTASGLSVRYIGDSATHDQEIWRIKMYTNFINFNRKSLGRLISISN